MFGLGNKDANPDKLDVQAYAVSGDDVLGLTQKIWQENARAMHLDEQTRKEYLLFAYANPKCTVWLQRDQGRAGAFELIIRWESGKTHEVFAITGGQPAGSVERAKAILNSMLTTPSVVLSTSQ